MSDPPLWLAIGWNEKPATTDKTGQPDYGGFLCGSTDI